MPPFRWLRGYIHGSSVRGSLESAWSTS